MPIANHHDGVLGMFSELQRDYNWLISAANQIHYFEE
jgi:hypothetical protein